MTDSPKRRAHAFAERVLLCDGCDCYIDEEEKRHDDYCSATNRPRLVAALIPIFEREDRLVEACKEAVVDAEKAVNPSSRLFGYEKFKKAIESVERERGA